MKHPGLFGSHVRPLTPRRADAHEAGPFEPRGRLLGTQAAQLRSMLLSIFAIVYEVLPCELFGRTFLIVPKLHHNAAVSTLPVCKSLSRSELVGAWRFELQTSCAQ